MAGARKDADRVGANAMSYQTVLFLDDRIERVRRFLERCALPVVVVRTANQAKFWLGRESWDVVFLDHDLNDEPHSSNPETNSGTHLAQWMAEYRPKCHRIVIHSTSPESAKRIQRILRGAGYEDVVKAHFEEQIVPRANVYQLFWWNVEPSEEESQIIRELTGKRFIYRRVGYDERPMTLADNRQVGEGQARLERLWDVRIRNSCLTLTLASTDWPTCHLYRGTDGVWRGRWLQFERMPIELVPWEE